MDTRSAASKDGANHAKHGAQPRVLILDPDQHVNRVHLDAFRSRNATIYVEREMDKIGRAIKPETLDVVLIMANDARELMMETIKHVHKEACKAQVVIMIKDLQVSDAVKIMKMGVADLIEMNTEDVDFTARIHNVMRRARQEVRMRRQIDRMKKICRTLQRSRDEIAQQVDEICREMVNGYQELACEVRNGEVIDTFKGDIKEQLDLEEALRCALRFIVERLDATNAAVFLPNHAGGYVVGGYVNYNCDRDTAEMVLQHLADIVAHRIADQDGVMMLNNNRDIRDWIGDDASYLSDTHVITIPCKAGDDHLASLMLFRDADEPYDPDAETELSAITEVFSEQLAKITRVHHRLRGLFADDPEDYGFGDSNDAWN